MDYANELKKIEEYKPENTYFKPEQGKYTIVIVSDPVPGTYDDGKGKTETIEMDVSINEEIKRWTVPKGLTIKSLYGQLMKLAVMNDNNLVGVKFTLFVQHSNDRNNYTIPEVL